MKMVVKIFVGLLLSLFTLGVIGEKSTERRKDMITCFGMTLLLFIITILL